MASLSFSKILVVCCIIMTGVSFVVPEIFVLWMNTYFLDRWIYHIYLLQFFSSSFIHGSIFHLLFNSVFVYYFWEHLEKILWIKKFIVFFCLNALFIGLGITFFSATGSNTIWISGFALAIIAYYTLHLRAIGNPEYKGGITAIVINIAIGILPGISFLGHALGVVFWGMYYIIIKTWKH